MKNKEIKLVEIKKHNPKLHPVLTDELNLGIPRVHYSVLDNLYNLTEFKLSQPIEIDNSYILIYLYKHNLKTEPTPNNSWNLIYQYALQNKQNKVFQDFVNKRKEKTFIKYFQ